MVLLGHNSMEEAEASADVLKSLGAHAIRLLSEAVIDTGVRRTAISKAATALENNGFLSIKSVGYMDDAFDLVPTFAGEEALEILDSRDDGKGKLNSK